MPTKKQQKLLKKANVNLVCEGRKQIGDTITNLDCLVVGVTKKLPLSKLNKKDVIPKVVDDQNTDVIEVGEIYPLADIQGGGQINSEFGAGTIGMIVKSDGNPAILTNRHVVDDIRTEKPILGKIIKSKAGDKLGKSYAASYIEYVFEHPDRNWWEKILHILLAPYRFIKGLIDKHIRKKKEHENKVDAALCSIFEGHNINTSIKELGVIDSFGSAQKDSAVKKYGITSGLTEGTVISTTGIHIVRYQSGELAPFKGQILIKGNGTFAKSGDSGAVVVDHTNQAVGLLYAASTKGHAFANHFSDVVKELRFQLLD